MADFELFITVYNVIILLLYLVVLLLLIFLLLRLKQIGLMSVAIISHDGHHLGSNPFLILNKNL